MGFHPIQGLSAAARYLGGYGTPTAIRPPVAGLKPKFYENGKPSNELVKSVVKEVQPPTPYKFVLNALGDSAKLKVPFTNKEIAPKLSGLTMTAAKTATAMGAGVVLSHIANTPSSAVRTYMATLVHVDSMLSSINISVHSLIEPLSKSAADPLFYDAVFASMTGLGLYQFAKHLGKIIYPATDNDPSHVSWQRAIGWTAVFAGMWGVVRFLSDTTGVHQFMPNGSDSLFGGWLDRIATGTIDFNFDLYGAYWITFITAAFATDVFSTLANTVPQIGYVAMGVLERESTGKSRVFNYIEDRPFIEQQFTIDVDGSETLTEEIPAVAAHNRVVPEVQHYKPFESEHIKRGEYTDNWFSKYVWRTAFLGAGAYLGYSGIEHALSLQSGISADPLWDGVAGVGGVALSTALLVSEFEVARKMIPGVKQVAAFKSAVSSLFNSERLSYYGVYTLIGGFLSGGSNVFSGFLQGLDNTEMYYLKTFLRGFYSPYLNRAVLAVRLARGERNLSTFSVIFPGFLMVMGLVEAQSQSAQALNELYDSAAATYEVAYTDKARADALAKMNYYEDLLENCIKNDCYGREETLALAKKTLPKIKTRKQSLGLPQ